MKYHPFALSVMALVLSSSLLVPVPSMAAQEVEVTPTGKPAAAREQGISPELMSSFLHLQDQVHATQLAVERARFQAETAASRNSEALNARLQVLEKALEEASKENASAIMESNRQIQEANGRMILLAGAFGLIGFLALALTGWLHWKTVSRLTHPSTSSYPTLLHEGNPALPFGSHPRPNDANLRLMDALGKLEHRLAEMEDGSHAPVPAKTGSTSAPVTTLEPVSAQSDSGSGGALASLIREGEELLTQEKAEKAIQHFESILLNHPGHPEVLLHKGAALERLHRDQEAIECYDMAIRADKSMTMAYLHKGGLFNRMERFSEAMECYEQALRIQEGRPSS